MKKIISTILFSTLVFVAYGQRSAKVHYISFDETQPVLSNPIKEYKQENIKQNGAPLRLYPNLRHQTLKGIGGCFNEIGGEALLSLDKSAQQELLNSLFRNENGGDLEFCRMAIGASDFGIDAYSYSMEEGDYAMEHFSLERERKYMLPYIKSAVRTNRNIKIFGSPWSPPAWMKYSGYMERGVEFEEQNRLKDSPEIYKAYALYLAKYVEAYEKEGIDIERVLIQNEQDLHTKYPSCRMPVEQMSQFVQGYMRPLFTEREVEAEIWAGTFRTARELEGVRFAQNRDFQVGFDGMGIQYTLPKYIMEIQKYAPQIKLMHTESNCFNGDNSWVQAKMRFEEVANYINAGSENFAYWNMILNETGKSGWDWKQNSLITIDRESKVVTYNPDYAPINFMASYLKPGSVRFSSFCRDLTISVEHNGKYYILVQNDSKEPKRYKCEVVGDVFFVEIPSESLSVIEI